jgi:hypothetical protein
VAEILFGFDTTVIAGITHVLRDIFFSLSPAGLGVDVSAAVSCRSRHGERCPARLIAAASDRVHRVVRRFAGSGDLGLLERYLSDRCALPVNL